jgi:hypothetical protein
LDLHANAVLTVRQRERVCDLVGAGVTVTAAALVVGCSRQTAWQLTPFGGQVVSGDHAACVSCSYSAGVRWPSLAWWRSRL